MADANPLPKVDGYPNFCMPKCNTEYGVEWDFVGEDDYGLTPEFVDHHFVESREEGREFINSIDWMPGENPRIVARIVTDWVEVDEASDSSSIDTDGGTDSPGGS